MRVPAVLFQLYMVLQVLENTPTLMEYAPVVAPAGTAQAVPNRMVWPAVKLLLQAC